MSDGGDDGAVDPEDESAPEPAGERDEPDETTTAPETDSGSSDEGSLPERARPTESDQRAGTDDDPEPLDDQPTGPDGRDRRQRSGPRSNEGPTDRSPPDRSHSEETPTGRANRRTPGSPSGTDDTRGPGPHRSTDRDEPTAPPQHRETREEPRQHAQRGGAPAEHLDEEQLRAYTTDRRSLASHVQLQWGFWTTISVVVLSLIITFLLGNLGVDPRFGAVVLIALFLLGMGWVALRYKRWVYQVQEDSLYLERGVATHVRTLVPYVRIQHVDTSRGPLERMLGLSTLVVYTAGSRGADVSIPGLTPEEARDLQQRVKELAIEAEGGDAV